MAWYPRLPARSRERLTVIFETVQSNTGLFVSAVTSRQAGEVYFFQERPRVLISRPRTWISGPPIPALGLSALSFGSSSTGRWPWLVSQRSRADRQTSIGLYVHVNKRFGGSLIFQRHVWAVVCLVARDLSPNQRGLIPSRKGLFVTTLGLKRVALPLTSWKEWALVPPRPGAPSSSNGHRH